MFCPECKAEYIKGITVCPDCRVPLVAVLPPEPDHTSEKLVCILTTFNAGDVALIRSILEGTDIMYSFDGETFNEIYPLVQPVRLFVPEAQAALVKELLKDAKIHFLGVSMNED